jgi:hypothetical protein
MDGPVVVNLGPGAEENGLAVMMADLVRQNLDANPHKKRDLLLLEGTVAIVAEDAEVALTLSFYRGRLTVHDGIDGIPDLTVRGDSDTILAMSNMPPMTPKGLRDPEARKLVRSVIAALTGRRLRLHGAWLHIPLLLRFSRVVSVNG